MSQGCISDYGSNQTCATERGGIFEPDDSSTWNEIGIYNLNLFTEAGLGYYANGLYGFETVALGLLGSGGPTLTHQVVAGIAAPNFWLGALPLSPWPLNFTTQNQPQDSLLTSLVKNGSIPSLSWGYTAGANGRSPQEFGSLTLGGYDTSRFVANNVTFGMYQDISRDLLVPVTQMQMSNGFRYSPSQPEYYFIDSAVPDLWLPPAACTVFEQAFSLTLDNTTGLYLVNNSLHQQLLGQNNSVTFTLGPGNDVETGQSSSTTFEVVMPYWAFDLTASFPLLSNNTTSSYFPLRQASSNSSQYTLGRAFLQAAYVIADHERANFSVHQALYPGDGGGQNLVSILSRDAANSTNSSATGSNKSSGLSGGAIAGIVIGILALLAIVVIAGFFLWRRKRRNPAAEDAQRVVDEKNAAAPAPAYEADGGINPPGSAAGGTMYKHATPFSEVEGNESTVHEAPEDGAIVNEMDGYGAGKPPRSQLHRDIYEMDTGAAVGSELESPYTTPRETPSHTPAPGHTGFFGQDARGPRSDGAPSPGIFSPNTPHGQGAPSPLGPDRSAGASPLHRRL